MADILVAGHTTAGSYVMLETRFTAQYRRLGILGVMMLLCCLPGCTKTPDEERITGIIDEMESRAQAHKAASFVEWIAEDFTGHPVATKKELRSLLTFYFLRHKDINVVVTNKEITVHGVQAKVRLQAFAAGSEGVKLERADYFLITAIFERRDGDWWVTQANWERALAPVPAPASGFREP